ncbi:MAG: TrmH family RNA methyltransferase [Rikenellaceae bacterium]
MRKILNHELGRPSVEEFAAADKLPVVVVLDNIRSLQNVGSFFRTSDAFGVESIALCGITATPPNRDIHKTALGAELTIPWHYYPTTAECLADLLAQGYKPIAIEQVENSVMLNDFEVEEGVKYALIFGNEVMGVDQNIVDMSVSAIEIPQVGTKHSVNVSVAGGVVLWHFFCQFATKL